MCATKQLLRDFKSASYMKHTAYNRSEDTERQVLEDLRNRARLGSSALPSVSFYSFINTHNRSAVTLVI